MSVKSDSNKLLSFGVRIIAFSIFPLIWFLSQAILFRELTEVLSRTALIIVAILVGSTFIFLLYLGMNKLIDLIKEFIDLFVYSIFGYSNNLFLF